MFALTAAALLALAPGPAAAPAARSDVCQGDDSTFQHVERVALGDDREKAAEIF